MDDQQINVFTYGFNKQLTRNARSATFSDMQQSGGDMALLPNFVDDAVIPSTITSGTLTSNLEQAAGVLFNTKTSFTDTTAGYRLGIDTTDNLFKFLIGNSTNSLYWNGSTLVITGSITATTGAIGGFEIGSDYIRDVANSFGLASTVSTTSGGTSIVNTARTVSLNGTTGLTMIQNASADDANILITLPFSVTFNGISYTNVYVGSNGYLTFGAGSSAFGSLSASNPAIPGIHINARDGSYQRVYKGSLDGNATYIIRYEGALGTSGTPGSSTVFWEVKFTAATPDIFLIDIGSNAASATGTSGVTSGSAYVATFGSGYVNQGYTLDFTYDNPPVAVDDVRFWAGATYANRATAPARITEAGVATFTSGTVGGWTLSSTTLVGGSATLSSTGVLTLGTSNDIVIISAADAAYRLWVGHATASSGPFRVTKAGVLTALGATISGAITASSGSITGAFTIGSGGSFSSGQTAYDTGTGFWLEYNAGTPRFSIGNSAGNKLLWNGTTLSITGTITASAGAIGGWSINATSIYTGTEDHSGYTANAGDITIYSSGAVSSIHAKNFYIDSTGVLTCTAAVISGGITTTSGSVLDGGYLSAGTVASAAANLALRGWTQTSAFSVTDADTVAWGIGTFTASDGTSYSIGAGNTGNMAAKTYIYLDIAVSTTAYQTTTTATTAIGNGKVLVAIAQNATTEATFMLLNNNSYNIDAANIIAGSITTNEIAATTITGTNINTLSISGKTVLFDTGTIGGWTLSSSTFTNTSGGNTTTLSTGVNSFIAGPTGAPTVTISAAGVLTATGVSVSGAITATTGTIGGFSIGSDYIRDAANSFGMASTVTGGDDVRFWAGATFANRATAPFYVTEAGAFVATSATVNGSAISNGDVFGDGSDGDVTIGSNTTITRDMFYNNLTISAGFSLNTGGFRIFVKGTCTIEATASIQRNGSAGGNGGNGTSGNESGGGTSGAAGAALALGSIQGSIAGIAGGGGGNGRSGLAGGAGVGVNGYQGGAGSAGVGIAKSLVSSNGVSSAGISSGAGGNSDLRTGGIANTGAAGGTITGTVFNQVRSSMAAYNLFDIYPESGGAPLLAALKAAPSNGGAAGGGSGAAYQSAADGDTTFSGGGGGGGGGGGQAGIVSLFARTLVNNGTISANGGVGGNGGNGGNAAVTSTQPSVQSAGGGGGGAGALGGNGGVVICVYGSKTGSGTITASGGAAGTKGTKGLAANSGSSAGTDGTDGQDGAAGNAGTVIELVV